jgi:hypothetical protein
VVRALVAARCGVVAVKARATLAADGSFALRATKRDRAPEEPGLRRVAVVQVSGRIVGAIATGAASARIKLVRGGRVAERCKSAPRAWQARTPAPEPVAALPLPSRGYFGLTTQARRPHAFLLRVDPGARRVQAAAFEYALDCGGGRVREKQNITPGGPLAANGSFALVERFTLRFSDGSERYRVRVDGRFTAHGANGTLSVTTTARSLAGGVIDRCRTGNVAFVGAL